MEDDPPLPNAEELRKLSKDLVEQAAKETYEEQKAFSTNENLEETSEGLESWNPDQVYQKAMTWVGEELQEQLLEGFLQGATEPDVVDIHQFIEFLRIRGLDPLVDPRIKDFISAVSTKPDTRYSYSNIKQHISREEFKSLVLRNPTILSAIKGEFVVEDFADLVQHIDELHGQCQEDRSGRVTTYIPLLNEYPSDKWGASICTVDGQTHSCGDAGEDLVTLQSVTKPIFYGICLDELGAETVHSKVGKEPSGHGFSKITLTRDNKPHNPLINTGAITLTSLYKPHASMATRFQKALSKYKALVEGADEGLHFNNTVYLSEVANGHRNYAIGHYLISKGCLDDKVNLKETLELYFQMCSIETTVRNASVIAAALANGGKNVFTGQQVISERSVQNMLSAMFSCGMYDYSGEWAFEVGIPAKSGVSGMLIAVIPDVMGIAMWSPPLDSYGNSVRGVRFGKELVKKYSVGKKQNVLHPFRNRRGEDGKGGVTFQPFPARSASVRQYSTCCGYSSVSLLKGLVKGLRLLRK